MQLFGNQKKDEVSLNVWPFLRLPFLKCGFQHMQIKFKKKGVPTHASHIRGRSNHMSPFNSIHYQTKGGFQPHPHEIKLSV